MSDSNYGLYGGIGSLIIAGLGILGFGKRLDTLAKTKMDITQFNEFKEASKDAQQRNESDHDKLGKKLDEMSKNLAMVYRDMPKRKKNGEWSGE